MIDRRLAGLHRARSFIDWNKASAFAKDLQALVDTIDKELALAAPDLAAGRLLRFISTHESVFERIDDSSGRVQDVYYQAIAVLGEVAERRWFPTCKKPIYPNRISCSRAATLVVIISQPASITALLISGSNRSV